MTRPLRSPLRGHPLLPTTHSIYNNQAAHPLAVRVPHAFSDSLHGTCEGQPWVAWCQQEVHRWPELVSQAGPVSARHSRLQKPEPLPGGAGTPGHSLRARCTTGLLESCHMLT